MTEAYNSALKEQAEQTVWGTLKKEAAGMSKTDYVGVVADVAGIFDPTPASDTVGAVVSLAQGDLLGAGLSVLGFIPYVGDLGKIGKIAKRAPKTARVLEMMLTKSKSIANAGEAFLKNNFALKQVAAARKKATDRVRKALLDARKGTPGCKDCAKLGTNPKKKLQMPSTKGTWSPPDAPTTGNGHFTLDKPVTLPNGKTVQTVEYRDGFPQFEQYTLDGKHDLWEVTGSAAKDRDSLTAMLREKNPAYQPPDIAEYTLHHFEDGTVGYVPKDLHGRDMGFPHSGGNSIVNNQLF